MLKQIILKYKILTKEKKFYWTVDSAFFVAMTITIVPMYVKWYIFNSDKFILFDEIMTCLMAISFIVFVIIGMSKFNKYKTLKGDLNSDLEFQNDKVLIAEKEYPITSIQKIEINSFDFKGALKGHRSFDGTLSNGVDNTLKIYLNDKTKIELNFQQTTENEIKNEKENLITYCNLGKLHYLNLLEILAISNYDEIQKFKEQNLTNFN